MRTSFCATHSQVEVTKRLGPDLIALKIIQQFGALAKDVVFSWHVQGERIGAITVLTVSCLLLSFWSLSFIYLSQ